MGKLIVSGQWHFCMICSGLEMFFRKRSGCVKRLNMEWCIELDVVLESLDDDVNDVQRKWIRCFVSSNATVQGNSISTRHGQICDDDQ